MKLELGNFKGELVQDPNLNAHTSDTEMFTLKKYIATNKLSRVRLYLMSKEIVEEDETPEVYDSSSDDELEYFTRRFYSV